MEFKHFKPAPFFGSFIGASPWSVDPTLLIGRLNDLRKSNPIGYKELVICLTSVFAPGFTQGADEEDEADGTKDAGGHSAPLLPRPHAHTSLPPLASVTVCATPHAMPLDPVTGWQFAELSPNTRTGTKASPVRASGVSMLGQNPKPPSMPHTHTSPVSVTTLVWNCPHATVRRRSFGRPSTGAG